MNYKINLTALGSLVSYVSSDPKKKYQKTGEGEVGLHERPNTHKPSTEKEPHPDPNHSIATRAAIVH